MKERILEFLKTENKSSALLAEEIGVQPSSISHIISGRNNPSLDFVIKLLSRYPSLSADWLLFGNGQMFRENKIADLFDSLDLSNSVDAGKLPERDIKKSAKAPDKQLPGNAMEFQSGQTIDAQLIKTKRIICFFDNNTFTEYFPGKD